MKDEVIRQQSEAAYKQWSKQWREHAKAHSDIPMNSFNDFENSGVGKSVLVVANGYSFEEQIETIKANQHNVDIIACDKTLGHLLDNGITPKFVMVCDANVSFEKYLKPWQDKVSNIILIANVCGNPEWAEVEWKNRYFFVNRDILGSEKEFSELSNCNNFIIAGTNVSNAMVILLTQCDNENRRNFFGYDKIILTGFDYSWRYGGKYYAFDETGDGKASYMRHSYLVNNIGNVVYTSGNLIFSRDWLANYVKAFGLPVIQCSADSLLQFGKAQDLHEQMQYKYKPQDSATVKKLVNQLRKMKADEIYITDQINKIGRDHYWAQMATI